MKKVTGKRFGAFIIDMIVVLSISSLFSSLELINPKINEYNEIYEQYSEVYEEYTEVLLENEKNVNVKEIQTKINDLSYEVTKSSVYVSLINIIVLILYFAVFQYFNKGQTIGKAILKIKVLDEKNNKPKFWQILVRSLIINSIFISTLTLIFLIIASKSLYINLVMVLQYIDIALVYGSIGFMLFRNDGKGLHDLVAGTIVKHIDDVNEIKIIEDKENEENKITKKETNKNTTTKKEIKAKTVKAKVKK